jgi:membrane protein DedA with SNARE-associated domain
MILIGAIGFLAFGFAIAGILGGGFLGLVIGRYAGKRITKTLANKKEVREIDIYEIRVRSYLKWADVLKNKY